MSEPTYKDAVQVKDLSPKFKEGLIVVPECVGRDGTGYYGEHASIIYKELKLAGAGVSYYTDKRKGINRFSAGDEQVLNFILGFFVNGVMSAATYDVLKSYFLSKLGRRQKTQIEAKILIASKGNDYSSWQEYKLNGSVNDAIKMIEKIREIHDENSPRKKDTQ